MLEIGFCTYFLAKYLVNNFSISQISFTRSTNHIQDCAFLALVEYFLRKSFYVIAIDKEVVILF